MHGALHDFWFQFGGPWVSVGLTLAIFTFLYRDNPIYRFAEHMYVGVSMGYLVVRSWFDTITHKVIDPLQTGSDYGVIIPTILGLLLLIRFIPKATWLSRYAFAFLVGAVSGMAVPRFVEANILAQMSATVKPVVGMDAGGVFFGAAQFNALVILTGVVSVLVYFFFSVEHKGVLKPISRLGIYFLMVTFGTAFGLTVMGRVTLLIGRMQELIDYSSAEYWHPTYVLLALLIFVLVITSGAKPSPEAPPQPPPEGPAGLADPEAAPLPPSQGPAAVSDRR